MIFDKKPSHKPESKNNNSFGYVALTPVDDADDVNRIISMP